MDAPLYTLIGALGGVLVTQVANYFLESKKGKNAKEAKKLELDEIRKHDLFKERRLAYTKYLEEFDRYINMTDKHPESVISSYYSALILASKETSVILIASLNFVLDNEFEQIMDCKKELFNAMQRDLEI